eukprot:TRINITY_DN12432_c0_g1_i1.p3 TRINITY_DN12432_c0_g1~~TRINITY_DN12432_c0_g1_i1.p3  ORF type:complete len:127 (+),score=28.52 TRINITY_DN12432_c0_g1_i1:166-546(+)
MLDRNHNVNQSPSEIADGHYNDHSKKFETSDTSWKKNDDVRVSQIGGDSVSKNYKETIENKPHDSNGDIKSLFEPPRLINLRVIMDQNDDQNKEKEIRQRKSYEDQLFDLLPVVLVQREREEKGQE